MSYNFIKNYLQKEGYSVYPHEMICGPIGCPHEQNRFVDVVAGKEKLLYAFEYKSSTDPVTRAVPQIENYRLSFDYVVLVAEFPRSDLSLNLKRGENIQKLIDLGAGVWKVEFLTTKADVFDRALIAKTFKQISTRAPLFAHHVRVKTDDKLKANKDKWFWLFYSSLDRRSNAVSFIKARQALEKEDLFRPQKVIKLVEDVGKEQAILKIWQILKHAHFPLLNDLVKKNLSHPTSIVEAAQFINKFNYDFGLLYRIYRQKTKNIREARDLLWKDLAEQIYGLGWRSTSQFIRGMVLRGDWNFPLDDDRYLEFCQFNYFMASKLGLVFDKSEYAKTLGNLADKHLNGNRGIISHALWFIRKRYCISSANRRCYECPLFNLCFNHKRTQTKFVEVIKPKLQKPIPENHEWVEQKFLRYGLESKVLKIPPHPNQAKISRFVNES